MLFSGLTAIAHNQNRRKQNLKLFEFGKTYLKHNNNYQEDTHLSLLVTGNQFEDSWTLQNSPSGFYYLKGIAESILGRIGISEYQVSTAKTEFLSESISLHKEGETILLLGIVDKKFTTKIGVKNEVVFADFNWDILRTLAAKNKILFKDIPKFPEVKRDLALLINETVTFDKLRDVAFKTERNFLKAVNLFDVYTGKNLPEGKKSYALSFTIQDSSKTLTDKQIEKIMSKMQNAYVEQFSAELR
jgi:phenylalanyl-tRNA synthetase beta chain